MLSDWVRLLNGIIRTIIFVLMIATLVEFCTVTFQAAKASTTNLARFDNQAFGSPSSPDPQSMGIAGGH